MKYKGTDTYGRKHELIIIDEYEVELYKKTLLSIRKRMITAFERTEDGSLRHWVNTHGPILDSLLEELGHRFRH